MALPNFGGAGVRKRIRKPGTKARFRIKNRKVLPKGGAYKTSSASGAHIKSHGRNIVRNAIIIGTTKNR